jgi:zinc protease
VVCTFATTIERDTLVNGLTVLTVEAHKVPMVVMHTSIHAGSVFDFQGKEGLAHVVSQMLLRGTIHRTADEIVETIESVGGDLSAFTGEDYAGLTGRVLSKDLYLLIDLLSDCLQYPRFDSMELMRLKREIVSGIKALADDPFEVSERAFRHLIFNDHPLGHFPEGYDSSVALINITDVQKFYDSFYAPNNGFIVFIGDFCRDSLINMLHETLRHWKRRAVHVPDIPDPTARATTVGRIISMDISQAYILLGHLGPKYGADDWNETRVMNYILGGAASTSRIFEQVREKKGLAYIAYSYFRRYNTGGYYMVEVQTKNEMASEVIKTVLGEMRRIQDTISIEELNRAKKFYTGHFPLTHDSYGEMADVVAQIEIQRLGLDYLSRYEELIESVTLDEMKAAALKYLHPDHFYVLIVGDVRPEDVKVEGIEWLE